MSRLSRRDLLRTTSARAGACVVGLSASSGATGVGDADRPLKVVVVGAHPDDPETTCGGTMARYAAAGHRVVSAYLTKGEAGIPGRSHAEAAEIRTAEALRACAVLKARAEFLGQIDGSCEVTENRYVQMRNFLGREGPDVVFTHWPIDTHRDHRVSSVLVYDAWLYLHKRFALYYCEAMTGSQTQTFHPTHYVDITSSLRQKHEACFVHKSQKIEDEYPLYHARMEVFRGMESGYDYAEAFVVQAMSPNVALQPA